MAGSSRFLAGSAFDPKVAKARTRAPAPPAPPAPPALPSLPAPRPPSPVEQVLMQALATIPNVTPLADYLRPIDEMEGRVRSAYNDSQDRIGEAYQRLTQALNTLQFEAQRQADDSLASRQRSSAQGQAEVNNLQSQVLADLARQGGPQIGGPNSAAQVSAQQNLASMALQNEQAEARARDMAASQQTQFADRRQGALTQEQAARDASLTTLNQYLNQLGMQRGKATAEHAQASQAARAQQLDLSMRLAQAQQAEQERAAALSDPLLGLERQLKERQLTQALNPPPNQMQRWSQRAANYPVAFQYMQEVVGTSEGIGQALARVSKDVDKNGNVKFKGRRVSAKIVRNWIMQWAEDHAKG